MKKIIKTVSFCTIFCILFAVATVVLKEKWLFKSIYDDAPSTQFVDGFYAEKQDTLDVMYLGSSAMFMGINPLFIWKNEGIAGYIMGSSEQRSWASKYYLKELLKYQKPKVVVLEVFEMFQEEPDYRTEYIDKIEVVNRVALDGRHLSKEKMFAVNEAKFQKESYSDYVFPILRYHTRWNRLGKKDFKYFNYDKSYYLKGQYPSFLRVPQDINFNKSDDKKENFPSEVEKNLDEIVSICERENIELLLIKTPTILWTKGKSKTIEEYAEKNKIEFIDYGKFYTELGITNESDFKDYVHLNAYGAEKLSAHLGKYIKENYFPKGYENEKVDKEEWNLCYEKYQELKIANELNSETDPTQYIKKLQNPDYIISIATKGVMNNDDKALGDKLAQLGLEQITNRNENDNYVAVIEKGKTIFEKIGNEKIEYFNKNIDDMPYLIRCLPTNYWGDISILLDKKEVCQNQRGINLVVYDTKLDMVVDSCCFADENTISREQ